MAIDHEDTFPDDVSTQIGTRCTSRCEELFLSYDIHCNAGAFCSGALSILKNTKGNIMDLKTWLNALATSLLDA